MVLYVIIVGFPTHDNHIWHRTTLHEKKSARN